MATRWRDDNYITTWSHFWRIYPAPNCNLLNRLNDFPNSILVTGCQRSGTTLLSRIINSSEGITTYWFGPDDELDAALILSGYVEHKPKGRYCFQTTYVNDFYREYLKCKDQHKVIWLLRNPFSVIYSMLNNWNSESLDNLYRNFRGHISTGKERWISAFFGEVGTSRLRKACWIYNAKISQIFNLVESLNDCSLMIVDYDELISNKNLVIPSIYRFLNLNYQDRYADIIEQRSLEKSKNLSEKEVNTINELCENNYLRARTLIPHPSKSDEC